MGMTGMCNQKLQPSGIVHAHHPMKSGEIVGMLRHELHLTDYRTFAMMTKRWTLTGRSLINHWIEFCQGYVEV